MKLGSSWLVCLLLPGPALSQVSSFDAADVHVNKQVDFATGGFIDGGRLELRGWTLLEMITLAYGVEPAAIVGGPNWLDDDRFDISAKGHASADPQAGKQMLQALLADRFKLVAHPDLKSTPVFTLTVSKKSPKLVPSDAAPGNCALSTGDGEITANCHGVSMSQFSADIRHWAGAYLNRTVIDKTGLEGAYDFVLRWNPPGPEAAQSVFQAVENQLGLKLATGNEPLPVLSVMSAIRTPTPNAPDIAKLLPKATDFEVASLKPSRSDETRSFRALPGGLVEAHAIPLKFLFLYAYTTTESMVVNAPKWLETDTYDLNAKAPPAATDNQSLRFMLRSLLASRFNLRTHYEDQPRPVYVLTAPKHAPKLKEADGSVRSNCKSATSAQGQVALTCQNTTMAQFAEKIRNFAGGYFDHPVIDMTGLEGAYDFSIAWTAHSALPTQDGEPGGVTAFQAVEKMLGCNIELQKRPEEVLVIDNFQRKPTEN